MTRVNSSKPGKQRHAFYNRKLHELQKDMHVNLAKEVRKTIGKKSVGVRKEDKVKIVRGKFKGKEGKIVAVNRQKKRVFIAEITRKKVSGKEILIPFQPSNLVITELYSKDKLRFKRTKAAVAKEKVDKEVKEKKVTVKEVKK